jgi:signal transduction histidine kinase
MALDRFIGNDASFPLEHRIFNTVILISIAISLFSTVTNYLLGLRFLALVSFVCSFVLGALYYVSVARRSYRMALIFGITMAFGVFPLLWMTNDGLYGSTPYYLLIFAAMITVSVGSTRMIFLLVGCLAVLTTGLLATQYVFSPVTTGYAGRGSLFVDNYVGIITALIVITSLYVIILNYYRQEHRRAMEYQVRLEKQETALEMARLDRLNLIGEMAASIGHEVRNPLTTIRGFLQLFRGKPEYVRHREHFDMMIGELDRANSIITEFLSLAKNKAVRLEPCDLNSVLQRIFPLIQAGALEAGKDFVLKPRKVPLVRADEGEVRQLVLNLASNALDATEPGGVVTVGTYRERHDAVLFVSDTGGGIPQEVYAKLGTPFVTTKEKGTGLGLAICYRIAERHSARVEVETGPEGTTFRFRFAALRQEKPATA